MKRKDILGDVRFILKDIEKSEILDESYIRAHLAKPKWLNPSKKELSKTMSIKETEMKIN